MGDRPQFPNISHPFISFFSILRSCKIHVPTGWAFPGLFDHVLKTCFRFPGPSCRHVVPNDLNDDLGCSCRLGTLPNFWPCSVVVDSSDACYWSTGAAGWIARPFVVIKSSSTKSIHHESGKTAKTRMLAHFFIRAFWKEHSSFIPEKPVNRIYVVKDFVSNFLCSAAGLGVMVQM